MNLCGLPPYQKNQKRTRKRTPEEREDEAYQEWIRTLPSCISGMYSEATKDGELRNPSCHVLRVKYGAGKGKKPIKASIPLTHQEHYDQHYLGEAGCLNRHKPKHTPWTEQEAKEWFEQQLEYHRRIWREII